MFLTNQHDKILSLFGKYRRVGGYMKNEDWFAEASIIDKMVAEKGFKVDHEYFFANAYNSP